MQTTVIDKFKRKRPFNVWYRDEMKRLHIRLACANTAEDLQAVEKRLREFKTFAGLILETHGKGSRAMETARKII